MNRILSKLTALVLAAAMLLGPALPAFAENDDGGYDGWIIYSAAEGEPFSPENLTLVKSPLFMRKSSGSGTYYMEPNYILETQDSEPVYTTNAAITWNHKVMETEAAWNHADAEGRNDMRGDGVVVAVLDEGVDYTHIGFQRDDCMVNIIDGPSEVVYNGITYDFSGRTGEHGTEVASVIAAQLGGYEGPENNYKCDGIAPNVTILSLCISKGNINISTVCAAIYYAVEEGGADVINLSVGGEGIHNKTFEEACKYAEDQGVIVVASAGNTKDGKESDSSRSMIPAKYDSVVSVSSCKANGDGAIFDQSYSFFNNTVDVCAPGTHIEVLKPGNQYTRKDGTSFASPAIAALAALLKQKDKDADKDDFLELLTLSSDLESHIGESEYRYKYGRGVVNIRKFIEALNTKLEFHSGTEYASFASGTEVPESYAYYDGLDTLPNPVKDGFSFAGWYLDQNCSGEAVTKIDFRTIGSLDLYARWEAIDDQPLADVTLEAEHSDDGISISVEAQDPIALNSYDVYIALYDEYGRWLGMEKRVMVFQDASSQSFTFKVDSKDEAAEISLFFLSSLWIPRQSSKSCQITGQTQ